MSSEHLASAKSTLKGNLGGNWNILDGASGQYQDLGIARKFGVASSAFSLRDIGAMNGRVVKVRRIQDSTPVDFSAGQIASGGLEQFAIGQDVLDNYNKASYSGDDSFWRANDPAQLDLGSGAFSIKCDVVFTDSFTTNTARLCQEFGSLQFFAFNAANRLLYKINTSGTETITLSQSLELGRLYNIEISRDSSDVLTVKFDGVTVGTRDNTSGRNDGQCQIGRIGGFRLRGFAKNYNFNNGQHIYAGDGNETSNWLDTGSGTTTNLVKASSSGGTTGHNLELFTGQGIDAFIDTWYDQSGNGRDATQNTEDNQPLIIKDGALLDHLNFDGNTFLNIDGLVMNGTDGHLFMVVSNVETVAEQFYFSNRETNNGGLNFYNENSPSDLRGKLTVNFIGDVNDKPSTTDVVVSRLSDDKELIGFSKDSNDIEFFHDGSLVSDNGNSQTYTTASGNGISCISKQGTSTGSSESFMRIYELITYDSELTSDRTDISNDIKNYYEI